MLIIDSIYVATRAANERGRGKLGQIALGPTLVGAPDEGPWIISKYSYWTVTLMQQQEGIQ